MNAGLRLLEASGKPEPWQEAPRAGLAEATGHARPGGRGVAVLAMTLAGMAASNSSKSHRIAELQKQNTERALDPATNTREIRLLPSRSGASNSPAIIHRRRRRRRTARGPEDRRVALAVSHLPRHHRPHRPGTRRDHQQLDKDSNGHLRIALNSSALGPGNYQLTLEGLDWRGQPQPDSWVTIGIAR